MIEGIFLPMLTVGLAELGDKSQLTILSLASKHRNHIALLLGVMLAFSLVDGIAILFGGWITTLIPVSVLKIISGLLFIYFGIKSIREKNEVEEKEVKRSKKGVFISSFTLIFFAEWADKTQLSSAFFATKYNPLFVFIGVILSLFILSVIAIFIGRLLFTRLNKKVLHLASGSLFIILGLSFLAEKLKNLLF